MTSCHHSRWSGSSHPILLSARYLYKVLQMSRWSLRFNLHSYGIVTTQEDGRVMRLGTYKMCFEWIWNLFKWTYSICLYIYHICGLFVSKKWDWNSSLIPTVKLWRTLWRKFCNGSIYRSFSQLLAIPFGTSQQPLAVGIVPPNNRQVLGELEWMPLVESKNHQKGTSHP